MREPQNLQELQEWIDRCPERENFAILAIQELLRKISIPRLSVLSSKIVILAA